MGITNWLKTHKPIDWKWIAIFILFFELVKKKLVWLILVFAGIASYPNQIDYKPIMAKAGDTIGIAYETAMTKLYEIGLRIGESLYPNNILVCKLINYSMMLVLVSIIFLMVIYIINVIMYNKKQK